MPTGPKILVVDDDPATLAATTRILSRADFEVSAASDGRSALELMRQEKPSLVLLDLMLPDQSGLDVVRAIRSDGELRSTRVVMLSAHRDPESQSGGLDSGADGYIARPVSGSELLAHVRNHVRQQELTEKLRASEARFRELIARQADGVLVVDPAGAIRFVNPAGEALFGRTAEQLIGAPFGFPVESDAPQRVMIHPPASPLVIAEMRVGAFEWEGGPAWIISINDVTERVRLEEELREEQLKTKLILDSAVEGIHGLDLEGRVIFENAASIEMLGLGDADELHGRSAHEMTHHHRPDGRVYPEEECPVHRTIRDGIPRNVDDEVFFRSDGTSFPVEYSCAPMTDENGIATGAVVSFRDITEEKALEAREQASQALLRIAGRAARLGGWTVTLPSLEIRWSDQTALIHGEPPGFSPKFEDAFQYYVPEDRERLREAFDRCLEDGTPYDLEIRVDTAQGQELWTRTIGEPMHDSTGAISGAQGGIQDISSIKAVEAEMTVLGKRLTTTLESMAEGFIIVDRNDWTVLYWNAEAEEILGRRREEALGRHFWDLFPDAVGGEFEQNYRKALEENRSVEFEAYYPGLDMWVEVRAHPSREGLSIYFRNVTEQKQARDALRESEERFRTLVETAPEAIFVQTDRKFAYVNAAAVRLFGAQSADELVGYPVVERFHPDCRDAVMERIRTLNEEREGVPPADEVVLTLAGDSRHVNVVAAPTDYEGRTGALVFARDMTERRQLESQLLRSQRLESIGTLAGGIAHDLNNLLAPIMMSVALLRTGKLDDRGQRVVDNIERAAKRGSDLVRQVLTFARGVEGTRITLNVKQILREIESILAATFPKNISVSVRLAPDLASVKGDPTQLNQVLLNLCLNARDAMPEGGTLLVSASSRVIDEHYAALDRDVTPGNFVVIEITDSGTGMPPAVKERIFDPFFTTKEVGKGTGLGLPTALGIVRSHGGFVNVYSEVGQGSTFKVYLPATDALEDSPAPDYFDKLPRGNGETVLVVDDEPTVLDITRQTLEAFGYRVVTAEDGAEALGLYARRMTEIDVILTDMMMPVMDGAALIAALRRIDRDVPVIASSGLTSRGLESRGLDVSVRLFLHKPYTADALLRALKEALSGKKPNGQGPPG